VRILQLLRLVCPLPHHLPQRVQRLDDGWLIDGLQKAPQAFGFRAAIARVQGIIDVDVQCLGEELRERPV